MALPPVFATPYVLDGGDAMPPRTTTASRLPASTVSEAGAHCEANADGVIMMEVTPSFTVHCVLSAGPSNGTKGPGCGPACPATVCSPIQAMRIPAPSRTVKAVELTLKPVMVIAVTASQFAL